VTVTDATGREVTINKPLEKVVSGITIVTELLKTIGVEDRLVAIDPSTSMNGIIYGDVAELPVVQIGEGNHYDLDFEAIINLDPDVVILGFLPQEGLDTVIETLEAEIPVIALSYDTPEQIMESVELLGRIFDREEAAAEYIEFFEGTLDMITARVAGITEEDKPMVYFEWLPYYTFNKDLTIYQNLIALPGGINAAGDMPTTYGTIDPEWVIQKNPDVIIAMAMPYSSMGEEAVKCGYEVDDYTSIRTFHESLLNRSELSEVTAIRDGRVHVIHYELPTVSCVGYAYMAKWLHPDLFEDLDPQAIHQEWLTRFMGIDYDLDEHGVFVYPET
jgi:iron complex transport system substrate-binding protein